MFIFSKHHEEDPDEAVFQALKGRLFLYFAATAVSMLLLGSLGTLIIYHPEVHKTAIERFSLYGLFAVSGAVPVLILSRWMSGRFVYPIAAKFAAIRQFTQDAGHELANPIANLCSRIQILERTSGENSEFQSHLDILKECTHRMSGLVEDLRMLARVQNPRKYLELSIVRLDALCQSAIEQMQPQLSARQITVNFRDANICAVIGDEEALQRVLINLLSNVVRYGKEGGTVELRLLHEGKRAVLTVKDDGPGVPSQYLDRLFSRCYKARTKDAGPTKGTGLGLAIVKAIIEAHNGDIAVQSATGEGTCFIIRLPKVPGTHPFAIFAQLETAP